MASGPDMNPGHWIEIQDRAQVMIMMFYSTIVEHPTVIETPELAAAADKISAALADFYQLAVRTAPE